MPFPSLIVHKLALLTAKAVAVLLKGAEWEKKEIENDFFFDIIGRASKNPAQLKISHFSLLSPFRPVVMIPLLLLAVAAAAAAAAVATRRRVSFNKPHITPLRKLTPSSVF